MPIDFKLPELGEGITEGEVADILVAEGDVVAANQDVVEIETGKAVVPVSCPYGGRVAKIHVTKGGKVAVGGMLMSIEATAPTDGQGKDRGTGGAPSAAMPTQPAPKAERREAPAEEPGRATVPMVQPSSPAAEISGPAIVPFEPAVGAATAPAPPAAESSEIPAAASPDTRRYARELGVDLQSVPGTGPGGRITKEDVKSAVRATLSVAPATVPKPPGAPPAPAKLEGIADRDAFGPVRRAPLTKIRETIAVNMARSAATIPHVTNLDDADITELERIRKGSMADYVGDVKLTTLSFALKAVALALRQHHVVSASIDMEQKQVVYKDYVSIGVAVDTERGLVVPVLREADRLSIPQIAQWLTQTAASVRSGRFKPDDLRGGTFTVSNLGAVGGTYSTPIINPPEVAVLLLGRARKMPVSVDEKIETRLMLPLSLSYDHRLVDGAAAARFLNEVKSYLEVPGRLLLAP
ncbi:MAG: 2-oxo acid dehydrogenase subunit E2 [Planctomycetia bacterium]|nr:2-oxo acid dehydrogenase subunit E2 [Planctomycetia bacterium]